MVKMILITCLGLNGQKIQTTKIGSKYRKAQVLTIRRSKEACITLDWLSFSDITASKIQCTCSAVNTENEHFLESVLKKSQYGCLSPIFLRRETYKQTEV